MCITTYAGDDTLLCESVLQMLGDVAAQEVNHAELGQACAQPDLPSAAANMHEKSAPARCTHEPGVHSTVCTVLDKPGDCVRMCGLGSSCVRKATGCVRDVTLMMKVLTVEDKCVYTQTHGQRRCRTHSCVLRRTWTRTKLSVLTKEGETINRVGVRLGWGCADIEKAKPSPNLSTLAGSGQKARGQNSAGFGLKRKRGNQRPDY